MKKVCAWCGKVLLEEPGEGSTHGICPECLKVFEEELRRDPPEPGLDDHGEYRCDAGESLPAIWRDFSHSALAASLLLAAILLASSALHFLTGGRVPDLIQWLVERPIRSPR